jgi:hypothetical protein
MKYADTMYVWGCIEARRDVVAKAKGTRGGGERVMRCQGTHTYYCPPDQGLTQLSPAQGLAIGLLRAAGASLFILP